MEVEIRGVQSADEPLMREFLRSLSDSTQFYWNRFGLLRSIDQIISVSEFLCRPTLDEEFRLAALLEGKIVGLAYLRFFPDKPFKKDNCSLGIVIADVHQGKGIGLQMMYKLIEEAKSRKMRKIWLATYLDNERAFKLYRKLGFVVEGFFINDENWDGAKRTQVSMALFLDQKEKEEVLELRKKLIEEWMTGNFG